MSFFEKNINLFLMIIIVLSVVTFAGSTVYFQDTLQELSTDSYSTNINLAGCNASLQSKMRELNRTQQILFATETDIRKYDELYEDKSGELSETSTELSTAKKDLSDYTKLYAEEKKRAKDLADEVSRLTKEKNTLSSDNNAYKLELAQYKDLVSDLQDDLRYC